MSDWGCHHGLTEPYITECTHTRASVDPYLTPRVPAHALVLSPLNGPIDRYTYFTKTIAIYVVTNTMQYSVLTRIFLQHHNHCTSELFIQEFVVHPGIIN